MKIKLYFSIAIAIILLISCDKKKDLANPKYPSVLIIVENAKANALTTKLNTYISDVASGDTSAKVIKWTGTSASQLKDTLESYYSKYHIKGAFFIGDLPIAMYEMDNWNEHEQFPCDIYYASPGTSWYDADQNGIFDSYSNYNVSYFIGRINGTTSEINDYLDKVHKYRTQGTTIPKRAFLFIDNDWSSLYQNEKFGLDYIYSTVDSYSDTNTTTKSTYLSYVTGSGAEYVNQLIHASPSTLYFDHNGGYQTMNLSEIISTNQKACFYNLFDCSGCRFIEDNLGMTYVMKTDKGLAAMGTTKTGGNYYPQSFNQALAQNKTWGQAFVSWWNNGGTYLDDKWKLGLVLIGDPMLKVPAALPVKSFSIKNTPPNPEIEKKLDEIILKEKQKR